jgi:hypothetical protein
MSLQAFNKLKGLLGDKVKVRLERCPVAEPITPEIVMSIGLRYLSGGKCLDLKNVYGLSLASVYRVQDMFIDAVNSCPELVVSTIRIPETILNSDAQSVNCIIFIFIRCVKISQ